ncbi:MAG: hypothetical protein LBC68_00750 [Prevotellaceae bacterium]|jgi:uncharacterized membrane protein YgcG|nr:hypothetical protein [Prevotellaceae bacterium]
MKNKILQTIKLFTIVTIYCLCMAGMCDNNPGGGGGNTKPQCAAVDHQDMGITINLEYGLTGSFIDVNYLRNWHPVIFSTNTGTITDFFYLINSTTKNAPYGCSSISVKVSNNNCSGNIPFYDDDGTNSTPNQLLDFPILSNSVSTIMTFKVETVTDAFNYSIVWSGTPTIVGGFKIDRIAGYGIPKYKGASGGSGGGGGSGGTGGGSGDTGPGGSNHHAYYLTVVNGCYAIVENASSDYDYNSVDWDNVSLISDPNVSTSALSRSVYINGAYNENVRWNEPYLAVLSNN